MPWEVPSAHLKIVFFLHFILTVWGYQDSRLPASYAYYNFIFHVILLWGMHSRDSDEPIAMAVLVNAVSILLDIITITVEFPYSLDSKTGFSIGMAILNLILRPITCIVLHRIQNERAGSYNNFAIPGMSDYFGNRGPYENIDQSSPHQQSVPQTTVDTGSPQHLAFNTEKSTPP